MAEQKRKDNLTSAERKQLRELFDSSVENMDEDDVDFVLDSFARKMRKAEKAEAPPGTLKSLLRRARLLFSMLGDWRRGEYSAPWRTIAAITAALVYFISPVDLIPDFIPMMGFLDDATVVLFCVKQLSGDLKRYIEAKGLNAKEYGFEE